MRQHLERHSLGGLAFMTTNRTKEAAKRLGLQDRSPVLRLQRYQSGAKVDGQIPLRSPGYDHVTADRTEGAAEAACRLLPLAHLICAEDLQQFGCSEI